MPTDALSWQALEAIATVLRTVRTSNGYRTDAGQRVSLENDYASDLARTKSNLFIGSLDMPVDRTKCGAKLRTRDPNIVVWFSLPFGAEGAWRTAHNGLADLLDALPESSLQLPVDVSSLIVEGTQIIRRPEGLPVIVAQLTARVSLSERLPSART